MKCDYCEEEILEFEQATAQGGLHRECAVRAVFGSAAHQLKECPCYGGDGDDPPGMSDRAAAKLAFETFQKLAVRQAETIH